ncbi:unnamed protein product [marine sediment metagenome]|uniref:ParB-like N-terminal domain-containing protein n=1 Tax=marine sediment metagenome TaxID=412755 RepID=X1QDI4_9ZZZZ
MQQVRDIPIEKIVVGEHEQRLEEDDAEIDGIAASIRRIGIVQPLILEEKDSAFHLVTGHRRLLAAIRVGLSTVPCIVSDSTKVKSAEITFAENFFRKDLSPVEQAGAIADEFKAGRMSIEQLAVAFHKSEHWVHSQIAICDWPHDVLEAVHEKVLSVSAASNLALVTDDTYRAFLVRNAVEQGASARTTSAWLQAFRSQTPPEQAIEAEPVPGAPVQAPAVPQVPCFLCGEVHLINEVSHVPFCGPCIQQLSKARRSTG